MSATVISLAPSDAELEQAWGAYEAARREAHALFDDPASTSRQRMEAGMRAIEAHRRFARLCDRVRT